jgi:erythromycin esterase
MKKYSLVILMMIFIIIPTIINAQRLNEQSIKKLNDYAIPFGQEDSNSKAKFEKFIATLNNKKIIALGESSHGTAEFNSAKDKIIRYLIQYQNVKTVALETDFCGMEIINNFVLNKYPDSTHKEIEFNGLYGLYGIYRTYEVYELAKWIQNYNKSLPESQQVTFTGIDMQDPYYVSISLIDDSKEIPFQQSDILALSKIRDNFRGKSAHKFNKDDQKLIQRLNTVTDNFKNHQRYALIKRHIRILEQVMSLFGVSGSKNSALRDEYLAENALWLSNNNSSPEAKTVIWAHNGHIRASTTNNSRKMGSYLREHLHEKYYALALSFNKGAVSIFDFASKSRTYKAFNYGPSEKDNSVEYFLNQCLWNAFVLNFADFKDDKAFKNEIEPYKYMRVIGAEYLKDERNIYFKVPVVDNFDGILFIKNTSAAHNIPRTK